MKLTNTPTEETDRDDFRRIVGAEPTETPAPEDRSPKAEKLRASLQWLDAIIRCDRLTGEEAALADQIATGERMEARQAKREIREALANIRGHARASVQSGWNVDPESRIRGGDWLLHNVLDGLVRDLSEAAKSAAWHHAFTVWDLLLAQLEPIEEEGPELRELLDLTGEARRITVAIGEYDHEARTPEDCALELAALLDELPPVDMEGPHSEHWLWRKRVDRMNLSELEAERERLKANIRGMEEELAAMT